MDHFARQQTPRTASEQRARNSLSRKLFSFYVLHLTFDLCALGVLGVRRYLTRRARRTRRRCGLRSLSPTGAGCVLRPRRMGLGTGIQRSGIAARSENAPNLPNCLVFGCLKVGEYYTKFVFPLTFWDDSPFTLFSQSISGARSSSFGHTTVPRSTCAKLKYSTSLRRR